MSVDVSVVGKLCRPSLGAAAVDAKQLPVDTKSGRRHDEDVCVKTSSVMMDSFCAFVGGCTGSSVKSAVVSMDVDGTMSLTVVGSGSCTLQLTARRSASRRAADFVLPLPRYSCQFVTTTPSRINSHKIDKKLSYRGENSASLQLFQACTIDRAFSNFWMNLNISQKL